jgi:hypothetical protein
MKKIFLLVALTATTLVQTVFAQDGHNGRHAAASVLTSYYSLKDALVAGDAVTANTKALELNKAIQGTDDKTLSFKEKEELLKHSKLLSSTKEINVQREHFALLSTVMISAAKSKKLSADIIYVQYCPMKKSSWLSSEKPVKNPYYGSAMLTCGKVSETIN